MNKEKGKLAPLLIRLFIIFVLLVIAAFLFEIAPYYRLKETYEKGVTRVVINNKDVTNSLPNYAYVDNGVVMMSADTVTKYFDVFVYYDEKYDTAIITNNVTVAKIKLGENKIVVNGETKDLIGTAKTETIHKEPKSGETIGEEEKVLYVPISSLEDITKANVDFNEKIIVTDLEGWDRIQIVKATSKEKLKLYKKFFSKTMGKVKEGEELYLFDNNSGDEYITARNIRGDIGYIPAEKVSSWQHIDHQNEFELVEDKIDRSKKLVLTWEYAENSTPDRSGQSKIKCLDIISPTWLFVNKNLSLRTVIDNNYINWARSQGYTLWPALKNDGLSLEETSSLVTDMKKREEFINDVVKCAVDNKFEGINIDFEFMYKKDVNEYSEFVRELAANLRRNNIVVSVDVIIPDGSDNYSLCYDRRALSKAVDYMMLMTYDQYGQSDVNTVKNGPTASYSWVETNINKMLNNIDVPKEKLILCVPFYFRSWIIDKNTGITKSTGTPVIKSANEVLQKYGDKAVWLEDDGQYYIENDEGSNIRKIWVENDDSLKKKVQLVNKYDLAGVASWRWGYESSSSWETIDETLER